MIALVPALVWPSIQTAASAPTLSAAGDAHPGAQLRVTGAGFERHRRILLSWDGGAPVHVRTGRAGRLRTFVTIPADASVGPHRLTASYARAGWRRLYRSGRPMPSSTVVVASLTVTVSLPTVDRDDASPTPSPTPATNPTPSSTPSPTATAAPATTPPPSATPIPATPTPAPGLTADHVVVAPNGNDASSGTAATPWRTLQRAASSVQAGTTVYLRAGTYAGFTLTRSGSSGAPITFAAYPGETAVVAGSSSTVNVIRLAGVHDVVLSRLVVQGAAADKTGAGIRVDNGSYRVVVADSLLRENRSYGISIIDSTHVTVRDNEITGNAEGVYVLRAGAGVLVEGNRIHHQDRMVVATVGGNDDHGGVGVALVRTTGTVTVRGNRIWGNRAVSPDYGYDGGAYEIYAASNALITGNLAWDNRNVIETGSDGTPCRNNVFVRNLHYGATTRDVSKGLILRCAENMLVANNTFYRLDQFVFDLKQGGNWGTTIAGLRIVNNVSVMASGKIYGVEASVLGSVHVDHNLVWHEAGGVIGSLTGTGSTGSLSTFRSWTGFDRHGVNAAPGFVSSASLDLRLAATSPAIDRATGVPGVTDAFIGTAPDIGRYESH